MSLPRIAIVGRPNVGKSSLLNRLARRRVSIVDPTPGITRDRVTVVIEVESPLELPKGTPDHLVEVIDTGGYGVYTADGKRFDDVGEDLSALTNDIENQIHAAIESADLILFVIDAQAGLNPLDEMVAGLLRKSGHVDRVQLVANKVDGDHWEAYAAEASSLGLGEPIGVSATSGYHMRRLFDLMWEAADHVIQNEGLDESANAQPELSFAIIGKRNAGKSTLLNALVGENRAIVSDIAGTTRDAIDVRLQYEGHSLIAIDTAGVRKKKSMSEDVEYYAYRRAVAAIRRADVCLLLVDATVAISQVDKKLSQELQEQYKPTVIVVNKWDLVDDARATPEKYAEYLTKELRGLSYAPIVLISAHEGEGLNDLIAMTINVYQQASHRESTGQLNRVMQEILGERGPSSRLGTQAKIYYVSQVATNPPTIVCMVNDQKLFEGSYERFMMNRLREELAFSEVPIRLIFRARTRMSMQALRERGQPDEDGYFASESE